MNETRRAARINIKAVIILVAVVGVLGAAAVGGRYWRRRHAAANALIAGKAALEAKDWKSASKHLRLYLASNPDDEPMLRAYAAANLDVRPVGASHVGAAISAYRRLLRHHPGDEDVSHKLARLYFQIREFSDCVYICAERLKVAPDDVVVRLLRARALFLSEHVDEAEVELTAIVEKHPTNVKAFALLSAIALNADGDRSVAAQQWVDRAVASNPGSAEAWTQRGRYRRIVGHDSAAAQSDLEAAMKLSLDDPVVALSLADEWIIWKRFDQAAVALAAVDRAETATLEHLDIDAEALRLAKFVTNAKMLSDDPSTSGEAELANRALAELSGVHRDRFVPTAIELYLVAGDVGSAERVLADYRSMLEERVSGGVEGSEFLVVSARVALAAGRPREAIALVLEARERSGDTPAGLKILASALAEAGDTVRAKDALVQYVRLMPQDGQALLELATARRNQDWSEVLKYAVASGKAQPTLRAKLLEFEARLALSRGRVDEPARLGAMREALAALRDEYPESVGVRLLVASVAVRQERDADAVSELQSAIRDCTQPLPAALELIDHFVRKGAMDEARDVATAAVGRHGDVAISWTRLAAVQDRDGKPEEAEQTLTKAVAALAGDERLAAQKALAEFLLLRGDRDRGISLLREIVTEHTEEIPARRFLLSLSEIRKKPSEAAKLVDSINKIEGDGGVQWKLEQARLWLDADDWHDHVSDITGLLSACVEATPTWDEPIVVLGDLNRRLGNLREAERVYRDLLARNAASFVVVDRLVDLLKRQGRLAEAEVVLKGAPGLTDALRAHRVDLAIGRGAIDEAVRDLERRVAARPDDVAARIQLVRLVYKTTEDRPRALRLLDEAAAIAPDDPELLRARVSLLHVSGEKDKAMALLDSEVARLDSFEVYWLRARYLAESGMFDRAEQDYRQLTTRPESRTAAYGLLASFLAGHGRTADAIEALDEGLSQDPDNDVLQRGLLDLLVRSKVASHRARARDLLAELNKRFPGDASLLRASAKFALTDTAPGSRDVAAETLEAVVLLNPADTAAHLSLVALARARGDSNKARSLVARGLVTSPDNVGLRMARINVELDFGNTRVAAQLGRDLFQEDESNLHVCETLAGMFRRVGDLESARAYNDRALELAPDDEASNLLRAVILASGGDAASARKHLEAYVGTAGAESVGAHTRLAGLCTADGDYAAAERLLSRADELSPNDSRVAVERLRLIGTQKRFAEVAAVVAPFDKTVGGSAVVVLAGAHVMASSVDAHDRELGLTMFRRVVQLDPLNFGAYRGMAGLAYAMGDYAGAIAALKSILAIDDDEVSAINDLAWMLAHHRGADGLKEAERLVGRGVARYPTDIHLLDTRGVILFKLERYPEARRDLERCIELAEGEVATHAHALLHLAQVLVKMDGESSAARATLTKAEALGDAQPVFTDEDRTLIKQLLDGL